VRVRVSLSSSNLALVGEMATMLANLLRLCVLSLMSAGFSVSLLVVKQSRRAAFRLIGSWVRALLLPEFLG